MKRVRSGCINQTLVFLQREELGLDKHAQLLINREEFAKYKNELDKNKTRYRLLDVTECDDGSITVRIRKQLSPTTDVGEYFD